jgi:hypothetical protein
VAGPGRKYELGTFPPPAPGKLPTGSLPAAYGTQKLFLAARDPHWLYAHWDLTDEQQRQYNSLALDQHLILRIRTESAPTPPINEIHLQRESRHWFIFVAQAGTTYVAELGYYNSIGQWALVASSEPAITPPDRVSEDKTLELATVAAARPAFAESFVPARRTESGTVTAMLPAIPTIERRAAAFSHAIPMALSRTFTREDGRDERSIAAGEKWFPAEWTETQERELTEIVGVGTIRHEWVGSLQIAEAARGPMLEKITRKRAEFPAPSSAAVGVSGLQVLLEQVSSPLGPQKPPERSFWFNINAEIIVYGATEPDARVTIAGRPLRLRPDGTFSLRFALPDGDYELKVAAASAHGDQRQAELSFSRATGYQGEVGKHPQDESLKPMPRGKG